MVRVRPFELDPERLYNTGLQDFIGRLGVIREPGPYFRSIGNPSRPRTAIFGIDLRYDSLVYEFYDDDLEPATREEWELQVLLDRIMQ